MIIDAAKIGTEFEKSAQAGKIHNKFSNIMSFLFWNFAEIRNQFPGPFPIWTKNRSVSSLQLF